MPRNQERLGISTDDQVRLLNTDVDLLFDLRESDKAALVTAREKDQARNERRFFTLIGFFLAAIMAMVGAVVTL